MSRFAHLGDLRRQKDEEEEQRRLQEKQELQRIRQEQDQFWNQNKCGQAMARV